MLIYYVLKTQYSVSRPFLVSNFIVVFLNLQQPAVRISRRRLPYVP